MTNPEKIRVLWISDFPVEWLPHLPDALRHLRRQHPLTWQAVLLEKLQSRSDFEIHVAVLRGRIAASVRFDHENVHFHVLRASKVGRLLSLFWLDTLLISKLIREIKPDFVHAWGSERGAALVASRLRVPSVVTMQGLLSWYRETLKLNWFERCMASLEMPSLSRAKCITAESPVIIEKLRRKFPNADFHRIEHAPHPRFSDVVRQPRSNGLRFLFVGSLGKRKGVDLLFNALEVLDRELDFKLTVISPASPGLLREIQESTESSLFERTRFLFDCTPDVVAMELSQATIFLLPTRADVSPNAVKEAVVAGVPVVAGRAGAIPDYVIQGENGLLFEPGDLAGFIEAIQTAASHPLFSIGLVDPGCLARMRRFLAAETMLAQFVAVYRNAAALKPSRKFVSDSSVTS